MKLECETNSRGTLYELSSTADRKSRTTLDVSKFNLEKYLLTIDGETWQKEKHKMDAFSVADNIFQGEYAICPRFSIGNFDGFGTGVMFRVKHPTVEKVRLYVALSDNMPLSVVFSERYTPEEEMELGKRYLVHAVDIIQKDNMYFLSELTELLPDGIQKF